MKKINKALCLLLALVCLLSLSACGGKDEAADLWKTALYQEDQEFGEGGNTVAVEVQAEEKTVTFTIHTEADTVGAALLEHALIAGEDGEFGMYIKQVNGITADYDVSQSYWAFYENGEYAMAGVDMTEIAEGVTYQLVYSK